MLIENTLKVTKKSEREFIHLCERLDRNISYLAFYLNFH